MSYIARQFCPSSAGYASLVASRFSTRPRGGPVSSFRSCGEHDETLLLAHHLHLHHPRALEHPRYRVRVL